MRHRGCARDNLKGVDVEFRWVSSSPVTGVSELGQIGRSSVNEISYRGARAHAVSGPDRVSSVRWKASTWIDKVIQMDQSPVGADPRSDPTSYTGLFTFIRELFAMLRESRARGFRRGASRST